MRLKLTLIYLTIRFILAFEDVEELREFIINELVVNDVSQHCHVVYLFVLGFLRSFFVFVRHCRILTLAIVGGEGLVAILVV